MATIDDLAKKYASRIRLATSLEKRASLNESRRRGDLSEIVAEVFQDVDGVTYSDSGRTIDAATRDKLFGAIDREVGVERGTFRQLKEASLVSAVSYEKYIAMLLQALEGA